MHRPSNAARLSPRAVKVIPAHDLRRVVHAGVSDHPTSAWTAQQLRKAFLWNEAPRYLVISISLRADSPMITSIFRRNHFGDAANARVACIQVVLLVHDPVAGFDELTGPYTHSVSDRTEYLAIPVQL